MIISVDYLCITFTINKKDDIGVRKSGIRNLFLSDLIIECTCFFLIRLKICITFMNI